MNKCLAYSKEGCSESFVDHVERVVAVWELLKPYYLLPVQRALGVGGDPVLYAALVHDFGKLARAYQAGKRRFYRHEVVSAYFAYKCFEGPEEAKTAVSAAVWLHHEPIITFAYITQLGESYMPLYIVKRTLEFLQDELAVGCDYQDVASYVKRWSSCLADELERWDKKGLDVADVIKILRRVLVKATVGGIERAHVMRAKIAAVLYPLVVADGIAAYWGRAICGKCGEEAGTKVVRAALSGAEPLDKNALQKLCP